ncbi:MoaD/ThiS family protein [Antrihabitans sp. YC3-6]|uniref:MoaD/ThiS family protein n=1 Tax=Antrihabitans stalagmiti TaxID=2799499 RepID=A0A934NN12_9NOCA|nr:MoaD/ThiS family protein [Antrihabitans stalagmiti]MBJ8338228.1 MoaD/ThiS family protein [Antrihabitans stalagmiti]
MVEVRYFAAIADATGCAKETLDAGTVGELRRILITKYGAGMDRMLTVSAYLVGDELTRDDSTVLGDRVDVLPPFAGG